MDNSDNIIDIRDVIKRVEELEEEELADDPAMILGVPYGEGHTWGEFTNEQIWAAIKAEGEPYPPEESQREIFSDEVEELLALRDLLEEVKGYGGDEQWRGDWYPRTLIRDSYFTYYAEELADSIGAIDRNANWPLSCIDWDKAADELQQDYSSVEFDGVTYWYR